MATPMLREQFEALTNLGVGLSAVFRDSILLDDPIVQLYSILDSQKAVERNQMRGGFGKVKRYTGTINYDSSELTFRADYEHDEFADGFAIERKLIDDEEYGQMNAMTSDLALAFSYTVLDEMASRFNNAFSAPTASYLGSDGVVMCSASHPYSTTDLGVQSNLLTTALTHEAVTTDRQNMMRFKNSRQLLAPSILDTLLVPPELSEAAGVIAESMNKSGNANNDINMNRVGDEANFRRPLTVIVSPRLTDTNNWFSVDSRKMKSYLKWYWRVRPEFTVDPTSDFNLAVKTRGYARWSHGFDDWRGVVGHNVT